MSHLIQVMGKTEVLGLQSAIQTIEYPFYLIISRRTPLYRDTHFEHFLHFLGVPRISFVNINNGSSALNQTAGSVNKRILVVKHKSFTRRLHRKE